MITEQRGEHNGTPLHKTMLYKKWIQFRQAGAPSRYGPRSKCRFRPCSRALVGAAEDRTQASCMRDKDSTTKLLLLLFFSTWSNLPSQALIAETKVNIYLSMELQTSSESENNKSTNLSQAAKQCDICDTIHIQPFIMMLV